MRKRIFIQILVLIFHYRVAWAAFYGLGDLFSSSKEPEEPKRIRVYLDDNEALLVPKNSKVEYINPIIELTEVPTSPSHMNQVPLASPEINKKALPPATVPVGQQSIVHQYYADQKYNQQQYYAGQPSYGGQFTNQQQQYAEQPSYGGQLSHNQQQYVGQLYYGGQQHESGFQQQMAPVNSQYGGSLYQQYKTIQDYGNFGSQQFGGDGYSTLQNVDAYDYQENQGFSGHNNLDYGHSSASQIRIDGIPPKFKLENLKIAANSLNYGGFQNNGLQRGGFAATPSLSKESPIAVGKLLKPILLLPNGYIHGVDLGYGHNEKPVEEDQSGDLKYDFRTRTHSIN